MNNTKLFILYKIGLIKWRDYMYYKLFKKNMRAFNEVNKGRLPRSNDNYSRQIY